MDHLSENDMRDTLLSFSECHSGDEYVEIYKTARGEYRVVHSLVGEDPWSGDWKRRDHERICSDGGQAYRFLLETMDSIFGEPSGYIEEALEQAQGKDADFRR